mgnify:FL=1
MKEIFDVIVRLMRAGTRAYARKWSFLGVFGVVFLGSVSVLGALGLLPEAKSTSAPVVVLAADPQTANSPAPAAARELPTTIAIPAIDLSANIANPTTTDIKILDQQLLRTTNAYCPE